MSEQQSLLQAVAEVARVAGATALGYFGRQLEVELNAHQSNPIAVIDEERFVSVGNFDSTAARIKI